MNRVRKILAWVWSSKERMVLAVMVCFLVFRVYQVVKPPPPPPQERILRPPGTELPDGEIGPGTPDRLSAVPPRESWTDLTRRPPWVYVPPGQSRGGQDSEDAVELDVLSFQGSGDGVRVRIRTPGGSKKWYSIGDAFESYELLAVDTDTGCIEVFSEALGKRVEICKDE